MLNKPFNSFLKKRLNPQKSHDFGMQYSITLYKGAFKVKHLKSLCKESTYVQP